MTSPADWDPPRPQMPLYPPPTYPGAPPPRSSVARKVVLGVVLLFLLPLASCGVFIGAFALKVKEFRDTTEDYLAALEAGRYQEAYGLTCDRLRGDLTLSEFTEAVRAEGLTGFELGSSSGYSSENGAATGRVEVELRFAGGTREGEIELAREGEWRVCPVTGVLGLGTSDEGGEDPQPEVSELR